MRDFIVQMGSRSEQERTDAIKNVMLTRAHFDAALLRVKGSLDEDAIEKSELQAWEMLYNKDQRDILNRASMVIKSAGIGIRKADEKAVQELRRLTFARKKDFAAISRMTEAIEKKQEK
jgi:transitional endoplasmic reticulum ATPase